MNDQLQPVIPAEISEDDEKIMKKRAKKTGADQNQIELERMQEKNFPQAQKLIAEFDEKLNALGFALQPVLKGYPFILKPGNDLRPLTIDEAVKVGFMKSVYAPPIQAAESNPHSNETVSTAEAKSP